MEYSASIISVQIFWKSIMTPYAQYINLRTVTVCPSETSTFLYQFAECHILEIHKLNKLDYDGERESIGCGDSRTGGTLMERSLYEIWTKLQNGTSRWK